MVQMDASRVTQGGGGKESKKRNLSKFSTMDSYRETTLQAAHPEWKHNNTVVVTYIIYLIIQ